MANFSYKARDLKGNSIEGLKPADSRQDILVWLRGKGLTAVCIDEVHAVDKPKRSSRRNKKVKSANLSELCWQLSTMVEGGVPLTEAVKTIADDIDNHTLKEALDDIGEKIQKGQSFSESIQDHPKIFDHLFVSMIHAGESGGALTQTLHRLAEHFERKDQMAGKIKKALSYPIFVVSFITLIIIAIMTFIIPRFRTLFSQMGNELPAFTEMFLGLYDVLVDNLLYIIAGTALMVGLFTIWVKSKRGFEQFCKLSLKFPLVGKIIRYGFVVVFCRTMATLLSNGVSVLDALKILTGMTKNTVIKTAIEKTHGNIVEGANISISMAASQFFPNIVVKMAQVGEESGAMPRVLDRTSNYFERKVDNSISAMTAALEPIMIISVGLIVSVVVVALYLPIFTISDI